MASKVQPESTSIFRRTGLRRIQCHLFITIVLICATVSRVYGGPAPVSVTPSSGSGQSQTFKFTYSHSNGFAALASVSLIINSSLSANHACYLFDVPASKTLWMGTEGGGWKSPIILGQSGTLQGEQCTVNVGGSSASGSGNNLMLNLAISFDPFFQGDKNVYLEAYDGIQDSGWVQSGTWKVTGPPTAIGAAVFGTGFSRTFGLLYNDINGFNSIVSASALFSIAKTALGGCDVYFRPASNDLWLLEETAGGWLGPIALGQTGTLNNSRCTLDGAASSSLGIGNNLLLHLALSFNPAFVMTNGGVGNGGLGIFQEVYDGSLDSDWHRTGNVSFVQPSGCLPLCFPSEPITPSAGSGTVQTFSLAYSTPIISASVAFYASPSPSTTANSCLVYYSDASNALWLKNDAGTSWLGPLGLGQSGSLQNSQCSVDGKGSSLSGSGTNQTLNLALTFRPSFAGVKYIAVEKFDGTRDAATIGGTWTVALPGDPPTAVSGSSTNPCCGVSLTYTDPDGASTIFSASALINSTFSTTRACYVYFRPASGHIWLMNDSGSAWLGPITLGQNAALQNSQCLLDGAISSAVQTGTALQLNLGIFFDRSFVGSKSIFMEVNDGKQDSGWSKRADLDVEFFNLNF
jgi:hypothetical protein